MSLIQLTSAGLFVATALSAIMALAWFVQRQTGNSGWIDVTWSLGVGGVAFIAAAWPMGQGWPHWRQMGVAVLAVAWCLRLGVSHCHAHSRRD